MTEPYHPLVTYPSPANTMTPVEIWEAMKTEPLGEVFATFSEDGSALTWSPDYDTEEIEKIITMGLESAPLEERKIIAMMKRTQLIRLPSNDDHDVSFCSFSLNTTGVTVRAGESLGLTGIEMARQKTTNALIQFIEGAT